MHISFHFLEKNLEHWKKSFRKRNMDVRILENCYQDYQEYHRVQKELDEIKERKNKLSAELAKQKHQNIEESTLYQELKSMKQEEILCHEKAQNLEEKVTQQLWHLPNLCLDDVPEGKGEEDNLILESYFTQLYRTQENEFTPQEEDFPFRVYDELPIFDQMIDLERARKMSGARFSTLKEEGALLAKALEMFFIEQARKKGYEFWQVPSLVRSESLRNTGQLPKFEEDLFAIQEEDLFLIPTGEVPLVNLFAKEILSLEEPRGLCALTQCFRKEAGSYGKDTKGIIRLHEFSKVELVYLARPEQMHQVFDKMISDVDDLLQALDIPYRKILLCGGDLGFHSAKTIDFEAYLPGSKRTLEVSSVSHCLSFQSMRSKMRYKDENQKNQYLYTFNGSGLPVGRMMVAILENYQDKDGNISIPPVLRKYFPSDQEKIYVRP